VTVHIKKFTSHIWCDVCFECCVHIDQLFKKDDNNNFGLVDSETKRQSADPTVLGINYY
jgi:hypothetical protein